MAEVPRRLHRHLANSGKVAYEALAAQQIRTIAVVTDWNASGRAGPGIRVAEPRHALRVLAAIGTDRLQRVRIASHRSRIFAALVRDVRAVLTGLQT